MATDTEVFVKRALNVLSYFVPIAGALLLCLFGWIGSSYFEARAFNRVTGNSVSTWDAMFISLRVIQRASGPKDHAAENEK